MENNIRFEDLSRSDQQWVLGRLQDALDYVTGRKVLAAQQAAFLDWEISHTWRAFIPQSAFPIPQSAPRGAS